MDTGKFIVVSPRQFWVHCCDARAYRMDRLLVAVGATTYVTPEAPECVPGLIEEAVRIIERNLGIPSLTEGTA